MDRSLPDLCVRVSEQSDTDGQQSVERRLRSVLTPCGHVESAIEKSRLIDRESTRAVPFLNPPRHTVMRAGYAQDVLAREAYTRVFNQRLAHDDGAFRDVGSNHMAESLRLRIEAD